MKDLFEVRFETKMIVGAASPKLAEPVMKAVEKVWKEAEPYVKRIAEKAVKDYEKAENDE